MILRRALPGIDSDKAAHDWQPSRRHDPSILGEWRSTWLCPTCGKHITTGLAQPPPTGCARPRFTGRYKTGDHVDAYGMRYTYLRRAGRRRVTLQALGHPHEILECDKNDCTPVLSGRAEAEKRRLAYLERTGATP